MKELPPIETKLPDEVLKRAILRGLQELEARSAGGNQDAAKGFNMLSEMLHKKVMRRMIKEGTDGTNWGILHLLVTAERCTLALADISKKHPDLAKRWARSQDRWPGMISILTQVENRYESLKTELELGKGLLFKADPGKTKDGEFYRITSHVVSSLRGAVDPRLARWRPLDFCPDSPKLEGCSYTVRNAAVLERIAKLGEMTRSNWKRWVGPVDRFLDLFYGEVSVREAMLRPRLKYAPALLNRLPSRRDRLESLNEYVLFFRHPDGKAKFPDYLSSPEARWNKLRAELRRKVLSLLPS